ncbi:MAG TPA: SRPBCC family protein [Phycisphaerales bacterium]|nr:SRPBCC family protein [Phycisphaerales bacterium]
MIYLWIGLGVVAGLAALLGAFVLVMREIGKKIPLEHQAMSMIEIHAPIEKVFDAIADVQKHPEWSKGVSRVDVLPDHNGMQTVRMRQGHNSFVLVRTRFEPPTLLERTISDDRGPFSGTWLYKLKRTGGEVCEVRLTETGKVPWPAARAMMKYIFGYHAYTSRHLRDLAGKFEPNPGKAHRG